MVDRFKSSIVVDAPAGDCYRQWHQFESFPSFMYNVKNVTRQGERRWHWVVSGPLGRDLEWDAEMDGDEVNKVISWHTVSESDVGAQGAVRFDEKDANHTEVTCTIQYEPPVGVIGEVVADIFSNPQKMVEEDLRNFKNLVESQKPESTKTAESGELTRQETGAHVDAPTNAAGSNVFTSSTDSTTVQSQLSGYGGTGLGSAEAARDAGEFRAFEVDTPADEKLGVGSIGPASSQAGVVGQGPESYQGPLGIDEDLQETDLQQALTQEEEEKILPGIGEEESPYLGQDAVAGEQDVDLIDMRSDEDELVLEEGDIFTESMDVYSEDLESFTEDLDEDIDSALSTREEVQGMGSTEGSGLINPDHSTQSGEQ
ncbi:MAG TPA: SRPBCC family protein [Coleofasciculaceae cyanobacterium]